MSDTGFDQQVEALFNEVVDLPPNERQSLLDERCATDPDLRLAVDRLLRVDAGQVDRFLETPISHLDAALTSDDLPQQIGRYHITRKLGEGGMGVVYEARQDSPRRVVALKIIRPGLASRVLVKRFERESQVLANLQHPGIAHIYEAGTATVEGAGGVKIEQPYFAMELIRGKSLREYVKTHQLSLRQRLDLLARLCDAVHYAHQCDVVHRDLKPGNVLIDRLGQPKILDFGVARITTSDLHEMTLQTSAGELIGTLPYMSPEQVGGDPTAIDARSDVYALGVILYQLLSERLPFELRRHAIPDAARIIRESEPSRLRTLNSAFRGDVDSIVAKALEKEPGRRYQSAADLASDIRRHLHNEPIVARPASKLYELRKLARRHVGLVAGLASTLVVLLLGVIVSATLAVRASNERDLAEARRLQAEAVTTFLRDAMASVDPSEAGGREFTMREFLTLTTERVDGSFDDQPLVEASLRTVVGTTHNALANYEEAETHLRSALGLLQEHLGPDDPETVRCMSDLGQVLQTRGKYDEAESLLRAALGVQQRILGNAHKDIADSLSRMAELYIDKGYFEEAAEFEAQSLAMSRTLVEDPDLLAPGLGNLAQMLYLKGDFVGAEQQIREAIAIQRRIHDGPHPQLAHSIALLAVILHDSEQYDAAVPFYEESLAMNRALHGEDHPRVADCLNNMAMSLAQRGDADGAEQHYRKALDIRRAFFGENHVVVARSLHSLAMLIQARGDTATAQQMFEQALAIHDNTVDERHPSRADTLHELGGLAVLRGDLDAAIRLFREALAIRRVAEHPEHPAVIMGLMNLGASLILIGEFEEAAPIYEEILGLQLKRYGDQSHHYALALNDASVVHSQLGDTDTAARFLRKALAIYERDNNNQRMLLVCMSNLGATCVDLGQFEEAETLLRKARDVCGDLQDPACMVIEMKLGRCLIHTGRYAEAEKILTHAHNVMVNGLGAQHINTQRIVRAMIELYEAWDKPEQAAALRSQLVDDS